MKNAKNNSTVPEGFFDELPEDMFPEIVHERDEIRKLFLEDLGLDPNIPILGATPGEETILPSIFAREKKKPEGGF